MDKLLYKLFLIFTFFISSVYANNGIWTYPEDIRAGVFGADENLASSDNYTFNNIVYFNRDLVASNIQISHNISVGDSLEVQNNIFASRFRSIDNPSFFLNPSGSSTLYAIFAEAYFTSGMGNTYYLRPAQLSVVHSLRVDNNLDLRGEMVNGTVPWARLVNHPSIDAGTGLVGGGDLSQDRELRLDTDFTDERYVNIEGDIMQGDLDMGGNRIENVASPINPNDVATREFVEEIIDSSKSNFIRERITVGPEDGIPGNDPGGRTISITRSPLVEEIRPISISSYARCQRPGSNVERCRVSISVGGLICGRARTINNQQSAAGIYHAPSASCSTIIRPGDEIEVNINFVGTDLRNGLVEYIIH